MRQNPLRDVHFPFYERHPLKKTFEEILMHSFITVMMLEMLFGLPNWLWNLEIPNFYNTLHQKSISSCQKFPPTCSFWCKNLLNCIWLTLKTHTSYHINITFKDWKYSWLIAISGSYKVTECPFWIDYFCVDQNVSR